MLCFCRFTAPLLERLNRHHSPFPHLRDVSLTAPLQERNKGDPLGTLPLGSNDSRMLPRAATDHHPHHATHVLLTTTSLPILGQVTQRTLPTTTGWCDEGLEGISFTNLDHHQVTPARACPPCRRCARQRTASSNLRHLLSARDTCETCCMVWSPNGGTPHILQQTTDPNQ